MTWILAYLMKWDFTVLFMLLETSKAHMCKIGSDELWHMSWMSVVNLSDTRVKSCHFVPETYCFISCSFGDPKLRWWLGVNQRSLPLI